MTTPQIDDTQIAEAAFLLWLDEGRPAGRDQEHWFRAAETLMATAPKPKRRKAAAPKAAAPKAAQKAAPKAAPKRETPAPAPKARRKAAK